MACPAVQFFPLFLINSTNFGKNIIEYKMCFSIFSTVFFLNIYRSKEKRARYELKVFGLRVMYSYFLLDFNENWIFS